MHAGQKERQAASIIAAIGLLISALLALRAAWLSFHPAPNAHRPAEAWFVQLGAYRERPHATFAQQQLARQGLSVRLMRKGAHWVLVLGPFASRSEARHALAAARRIEPEAFIWHRR